MSTLLEYINMVRRSPIILAISIVLLILPIIFQYLNLPFPANMLFLALMYAIAAMAWNLLTGYTGQLSIGHAIFFGIGAYTTMILMLYYKITPWIGIVISGFMAMIVGLALGVPLFRLRSHWFTLATIASAEIFRLVFMVWPYVGGSAGLQAPIVAPEEKLYYIQYAGPFIYCYIALAILAIELIVLHRIVNSKIGYYLQAIREDENAAAVLGVNVFKYKMIAMAYSAFFTGLAGALYTIRFRFVDPFAVFDLITISVYIVVAGIIGGIYSFIGPLIGAFIFLPITEYVRVEIVARFPRYYGLHVCVVGIILLIISMLLPEGIYGFLEKKGIIKHKFFEEESRVVGGPENE